MSAHDPASDLARIARDAHRWPVRVDPATYAVLTLALDLWRETGGAFDVTVAPALAREGLLPSDAFSPRAACGRTAALELLDDDRVRASESVAIDLGGIAKGYAVDRAVDALRTSGASSGIVNAGGDLRVFGMNVWFPVRVRHPASPNLVLSPFDVSDFAVATSADYFAAAPALVDPGTRRARPFASSVTVAAPSCALADALTKIVALRPAAAPSILARHDAQAFRIAVDRDQAQFETTCGASHAHLRLHEALAA